MKNKLKIITFLFALIVSLNIASPALAKCSGVSTIEWLDPLIEDGLIIPCGCLDSDTKTNVTACGLSEAMQTIANLAKVILAITGSGALLMFIYGGTMFIISAGNQERVQKAKDILKAAVVGLAIIFCSWLIVNFIVVALQSGTVGTTTDLLK